MAHSMADVARGKALLICPTPALQAGLCRIVEARGLSPVVAESLEHGETLTASSPTRKALMGALQRSGDPFVPLRIAAGFVTREAASR